MADNGQRAKGVPLTGAAADEGIYGAADPKYAGYVQEIGDDDEAMDDARPAPKTFGRGAGEEVPEEADEQVCVPRPLLLVRFCALLPLAGRAVARSP